MQPSTFILFLTGAVLLSAGAAAAYYPTVIGSGRSRIRAWVTMVPNATSRVSSTSNYSHPRS